ncbi:SAM-dependent methyltransferase [Nonomuraea sp. NPDC050663]|uniref:SAM-dependent methyltransferase n=1 Tax=Nonomuraea sp. NPDC050663 TaxID=3364370 RepID=UPI0037BE15CB
MTNDEQAPPGIDARTPNMARMYDYALGGKDNFESDRQAVGKLFAMSPENRYVPLVNRQFLRRAVRFAARRGIDQYLDLGAGLPSQGNVHEVAKRARPRARVVYVDNDPVVAVHARALLSGGDSSVAVVEGDIRDPEKILGDADVNRLIDFTLPAAVLLVSVLHGIADDENPAAVVRAFCERLAPGSFLILSHLTREGQPPDLVRRKEEVFARSNTVFSYRARDEILRYFDGLDLVEPGLTPVTAWRPDEDALPELEAAGAWWLGGVGRR